MKALVFKFWFCIFDSRIQKRKSLLNQVETLSENRTVTVFVTGFVAWRHDTKLRRIECGKRQSIEAVLLRFRFATWIKSCLSREIQRQMWLRITQSACKHWVQESLSYWKDFDGILSQLERTRLTSTFSRIKLRLTFSQIQNLQVRKCKGRSLRSWNACRLLVSRHRSNTLKKTMLVWRTLHSCSWLHRERVGLKVLRGLYAMVIERSLRWVLEAWRSVVLNAANEALSVRSLRALRAWRKRAHSNRALSEKIPLIRSSSSINLVRRFRSVFDRLRHADLYSRKKLSKRVLCGWLAMLIQSKMERRKSRFLSRRSHINCLKTVLLKWGARTACSRKTRYRETLIEHRSWIRWKAFTINQRVATRKKFLAIRFRQSFLAYKVFGSVRSVVYHVRTLNHITAPRIRDDNLLRRIWRFWTVTVRPVLQREIAVEHRVERFSITRLACKSLRILLTHSTEKRWKRVEETLNRSKYRNLQLKRFGSEFCSKLRNGLHAANSRCRFEQQFTLNRQKTVFNHLKSIHRNIELQNAMLRRKTIHFAFLQLKRKMRTLKKIRIALNHNILEKFLLIWVQYLSTVLSLRLRFTRLHARISTKTKRSVLSEWVACFNQSKVASAYHRISVSSHQQSRVLLEWNRYVGRMTCMRRVTRDIQRKLLRRRLIGVKRAAGSLQRRRKMESLIAIEDAVERDRGHVISSVLLARKVIRGWRIVKQNLNEEIPISVRAAQVGVDAGKLESLRLRIDQLRENLIVIRE